jgi:hypothetical protein
MTHEADATVFERRVRASLALATVMAIEQHRDLIR